MKAQSIPELTNYEYNELSYNTASAPIKGSFVKTVCKLINKCGITVHETDTFDDKLEKAVKAFQKKVNITPTGILTTAVLQSMIVLMIKLHMEAYLNHHITVHFSMMIDIKCIDVIIKILLFNSVTSLLRKPLKMYL